MSATEKISIDHPVKVETDCTARVAFNLMAHISEKEEGVSQQKRTRDYWLTLYRQCFKAASGAVLSTVLEQK
jgi:hypothetical protein